MVRNGKAGKRGLPAFWNEYQLCREFGWTPKELYEQDMVKVSQFLSVICIERDEQNSKLKKQKKIGKV